MSEVCSGGSNRRAIRWNAALKSANGLHLAAAPTFAMMALLTALFGDGSPLCSIASASPLDGMVAMYVLMAAFHLPPWLKLIAGGR